ncbi:hypothetical protein DIC82_15690 [Clostridium beijerinckii]|nr:hypothetical protein DIC82_15690 [Clostridium beijerinckii]
MLRLTVFEFVARIIPEAFVLIFAMVVLSNTKFNAKRYIISSLLFGTYVYSVRMLPINYGVHTILDIVIMMIIMSSINKTDIILAIKASLITTILLFICEGLNMLLLSLIFKDRLESIMLDPMLKTLYGFPSLICFTIITIIYYLRKRNV